MRSSWTRSGGGIASSVKHCGITCTAGSSNRPFDSTPPEAQSAVVPSQVIQRTAQPTAGFRLIDQLGAAALQVGDNKAGIGSLGAGLDPRDDALDPAPAAGGIVELRKAPHLAARRCRSEAFGSGFLQRLDMAAQRRIGSQPQQPIDPAFSAPVEDFRAAVVRIGAQQDLDPRPEGADGANETAQE